jgi:membrane protease YdiL (CAAX protease family)
VAFGWFIVTSAWSFVDSLEPTAQFAPITELDFRDLVVQEMLAFGVLGWFLWRRGWTPTLLGLAWHQRPVAGNLPLAFAHQALWGVALAFAVVLLAAVILALLGQYVPHSVAAGTHPAVAPGTALPVILAVCLVNPIFEELFVCSYLMTRLASKLGAWPAIHISTAIRLSYHLYQGPIAVLPIIPVGLIFAYWYTQRQQLWPVIIAHAVLDLLALLAARQPTTCVAPAGY